MNTALDGLLDEVRLLWHVMSREGERLHRRESVTLGMRAVLEALALHGADTVPHIARRRQVSRQHVQALVNTLNGLGLVGVETNPAHRRSVLVRLTPRGARTIERMKDRERRFLQTVGLGGSVPELQRAARTLRAVRRAIGGGA